MADPLPTDRPGPVGVSTIVRKVVMAVTGLVLFGFVFVHMLGNLQMFLPDHEAINHYGTFLREFLHGGGIWVARAVLLGAGELGDDEDDREVEDDAGDGMHNADVITRWGH